MNRYICLIFSDVEDVIRRSQIGQNSVVSDGNGSAYISDGLVKDNGEDDGQKSGPKTRRHEFKLPENDNNIQNLSNKVFAPQSKKKSNGL